MRLDGKVALVTGASAGIGAAVAERLAVSGAQVVVHGRDAERTAAVAARVGGVPVLGDLAAAETAAEVADAALAVHGRIDILVANAGLGWSGPFVEMRAEEIDQLVALDLLAPLQLVRCLLPSMVERGSGHVALVGSIAGRTAVAGEAVYAATKAALDVFAESLRLEIRGSGVSVSLTIPGVVDTGFFSARGRPYDRKRPRPLPATTVAQALVDGIANDRAEIWIPGWLRVAPAVRALAPGLYRRLSARFGERVMPR
ncbi:SDR family NAD(P)-dependent oxidoreductase [Kribbella jiaozuonensis]|uniref:SDR family NAD(P)-dependent oxidoreductase n=1 Tax=Kribbella jiaozuonensis TaxID=2575441 RepID=A0A4U3LPG0_9ACTN|nr:SDR family NAD(P)-dependent oxidoreductase [Kribbella jiaozuonensis]TKK76416.1 SDR family NAD(P)-dependent oxidoreductase [Kribbella jiaozuonensis]